MPANKKAGVPKGFAFAPIGGRTVAPIPPAPGPASAEADALELSDGVAPPPAKKMRTVL